LTAEQQKQLKERDQLAEEAQRLRAQGNLVEAIATVQKVLAIERKVFGNVHEEIAGSLDWLSRMHVQQEEFLTARNALREVLAIQIQLHGDKHWRVTDARLELAHVEKLAKLDLEERRQLLEADELMRKVTALSRQTRDREALPLAQQALEIRKKVLGKTNELYATTVAAVGLKYDALGDYAKAEPLFLQALEIRRQVLGEQHPVYAANLGYLGGLYWSMGDHAKAEPLLHSVVDIHEHALGGKHSEYPTSLNNLGLLYRSMGDYIKAESLFRKALEITGQTVGSKHPDYATGLDSLAGLYRLLGDYAKAEPLYREALAIRKHTMGAKHPHYAYSLNNLALLYEDTREYAKAEPLLLQALHITEQAQGKKHPSYAGGLLSLAELYVSTKKFAKAEPLLREAIEIYKQVFGEMHPYYATGLNNLANLYQSMGDHARAAPLLQQASEVFRQVLGAKHASYAHALDNLALALLFTKAPAQAEPFARQALQIAGSHVDLNAVFESERQQLVMTEAFRHHLDVYLSIAAATEVPLEQLYAEVLAWKSSVAARQQAIRLMQRAARGEEKNQEAAKIYADLAVATRRLAALSRSNPDAKNPAKLRHDLEEESAKIERLESALAGASTEFREHLARRKRTPADVRNSLPADVVLVDVIGYAHMQAPQSGQGKETVEWRLAAFVVSANHPIERLDLGSVIPVARAIYSWRKDFGRRRANKDDDPGTKLRRLVWEPLERHLKGAKIVLLSPDGDLACFPWAALPGKEPGKYLLEETGIVVVPIPALLPEMLAGPTAAAGSNPSLLLVGDVDYDGDPGIAGALATARSAPRGAGVLKNWPRLPATRPEILAIKQSFQRRFAESIATELRREQATESAVRQQAPRHRYLHFATHGYFAPPQLRSALTAASKPENSEEHNLFLRQDISGFHPGLLSGLVLAGANQNMDIDRDDGILTALEVGYLDLSGVDLATLSACETGLGEKVGAGEGLMGLQRAFQVAGARTIVASLWKVDDAATLAVMKEFYTRLWDGKHSRLEALRQAQLALLKGYDPVKGQVRGVGGTVIDVPAQSPGTKLSPFYWAAFTLTGDWR
jgi:CHAT domain-containing protein